MEIGKVARRFTFFQTLRAFVEQFVLDSLGIDGPCRPLINRSFALTGFRWRSVRNLN